jgi:hypothetical protein
MVADELNRRSTAARSLEVYAAQNAATHGAAVTGGAPAAGTGEAPTTARTRTALRALIAASS